MLEYDPDSPITDADWQDSYNANDYEAEVEEFDNETTANKIIQPKDIFGNFFPTFYQYEWYKHFNQTNKDGYLETHLEGTAIVHRRAGKTVGVFKCVLLPRMLAQRGLYLHVFPTLTQGRAAIWNGQGKVTRDPKEQAIPYLELIPKELWKKKNNAEMSLELINGSVYRVVGAIGKDGTGDHLRGLNAIGIIPDEYPKWKKDIVPEIFSPMIAQNGGFIFKVGTPWGENHGQTDYLFAQQRQVTDPKVKAWLYTIDDTYYNPTDKHPEGERIVTQEFIDREIARGVDPDKIRQEYYCDFKATSNAVYYRHQINKLEDEQRYTRVPHDPRFPVYAFWDLGKNGTNAVWLCQFPDQNKINCIHYDCDPELALWQQHVKLKRELEYVIDKHYYPWDGNVGESSGMTKIEFVRSQGIHDEIEVVARTKNANDGVEYGKALFTKLWIDETNCHFGMMALKNYQKEVSSTNENFGSAKKNKFIHGADALRTMFIAYTRNEIPIGKATIFDQREIIQEYEYQDFEL